MKFKEEVLASKSIIILEITGQFSFDEIARLGVKYRKRALGSNYRLIFDFSAANCEISISDIQSYFKTYINPVDERLNEVPVTYVSSEKHYAAFKVIQQIWENQGISIMVFKDLEAGIKWFESTK